MVSIKLLRVSTSLLAVSVVPVWSQQGGITTGGSSNRPIWVSGRVSLADGRRLPKEASIELVCQGQAQFQGTTDSKGKFNVELGLDRYKGVSDAGAMTSAQGSGFGGQLLTGRVVNQVDGMSIVALIGCSMRAVLPGYRSDAYELSRIQVGDVNTNVGTLVLHELTRALDRVESVTAGAAPKSARKALEKATELDFKGQSAGAEAEYKKAIAEYSKYADAWQDYGDFLVSRKRGAEARRAFLEASACDPKFPRPYLSLARLSAAELNWQDALERSEALLKMDPGSFPQAYYYAAVAYFNTGAVDKAIEKALQAVKIDTVHAVPLAEQLLGVAYESKGDYRAAAEQFRNYIEHAPFHSDVETIKVRMSLAEARAQK
jgi:tetratricopeptide (TPR) repeat protein